MTRWSFYRLFTEVVDLSNKEGKFINWLIDKNFLPSSKICVCGHKMKMISQKDGSWGYFVCDCISEHEDGSPHMVSMFKGSLFEKIQFDPLSFAILMLCYAKDFTIEQAVEEVSYRFMSPSTVGRFYLFCNETISEAMFNNQKGNDCIGGGGIIIELCRSKFGSRNNSDGRINKDTSILCMIEKDSKRYIVEVYEEEKQDFKTLFELIRHRVIPGTTVITDRFSEYMAVDQLGLYHFCGDYSLFPGCCHELQQKSMNSNQHRELTGDMVMKQIFRQHCLYDGIHRFDSLINIISVEQYHLKTCKEEN